MLSFNESGFQDITEPKTGQAFSAYPPGASCSINCIYPLVNVSLKLNYDKTNKSVNLTVNKTTQSFTLPNSFNGKKIVLWLAEDFNTNVTKVKISNYSSTLTIPAVTTPIYKNLSLVY